MDGYAFIAAALAHGDIAYRPLDRFPYDLAFGLIAQGGSPAKDAWRRVLGSGQVAPAAPSPMIGQQTYAAPAFTVDRL